MCVHLWVRAVSPLDSGPCLHNNTHLARMFNTHTQCLCFHACVCDNINVPRSDRLMAVNIPSVR